MEVICLKNITVILVHYDHPQAIYKALVSLKTVRTKIASIYMITEKNIDVRIPEEFAKQIQFIQGKDVGIALNHVVSHINSSYVMFLEHLDYLSPQIQSETISLPPNKSVLGTYESYRNELIAHPFFVRTEFIKTKPFLSSQELPFKEALLPVWLSQVDQSSKLFKHNLIRKLRHSRNSDMMEKQKFIGKYQRLKKNTSHPTLSVLISNYNMEKYVSTSIRSCLLQTVQANQILMMDDGSTDGSRKRMQRYHDGNRIFFFSKQNEGKAKALNELLEHVTSEYVLELDADDFLDPNAIAVIKEHLTSMSEDAAVLYGNLRRWKQTENGLLIKGIKKGRSVQNRLDFFSYRFPLGPRIYRTSYLRKAGGFPVITFQDGRLYEDVSVLYQLIGKYRFQYRDFTVYNVREHKKSITQTSNVNWNEFLNALK